MRESVSIELTTFENFIILYWYTNELFKITIN